MIRPFTAVVNCSLWVVYGLRKKVRDGPVTLSHAPGVLLGAITFATAL